EDTHYPLAKLIEEPSIAETGKDHLQVQRFHIYTSRRTGGRFGQQANFIIDLETLVPEFYKNVGQHLSVWQKKAPRIKEDKDDPESVSVEAISEVAEDTENL
ncbi:MAG: hypothetical protein AAF376_07090, partial [Pseudomonadota bacterium]